MGYFTAFASKATGFLWTCLQQDESGLKVEELIKGKYCLAQHSQYMADQINLFYAHGEALRNIDIKIGLCAGVSLALWVNGNIGMLTALCADAGIVVLAYLYSNQYLFRKEVAAEFNEQLGNLQKLYRWCAVYGPKVTHDKDFLKLFGTIAPYLKTSEVILWDNYAALSEEYKKILTEPPHNIQLVGMNNTSECITLSDKSSLTLFRQPFAEAKQKIYAYQEKDMFQSAMEMIQNPSGMLPKWK